MSGLQIFNAHLALYWCSASDFDHPLVSVGARNGGDGRLVGVGEGKGGYWEDSGYQWYAGI